MRSLIDTPLDKVLADWWDGIDPAYKKAFFFVVSINLLAFGFEMTNLTLHHDDVSQIFVQDDILGHYLGRFGVGKLHYYGQNAYFMPFLQMLEGMLFMSLYGILIARFWGAQNAMDIVLVAAILCVFPFMAQLFQYNTSMATYSLAHLLAALAVILSTRATFFYVAVSAIIYTAAFSIYQGVVANSATIFLIWALINLLFAKADQISISKKMLRSTIASILSVIVGGLIYLVAVSFMNLSFDSYQSAGNAFSLSDGLNLSYAITEILQGSRSFFFWPENYFPDYLKKIQLVFLVSAGICCIWLPKSRGGKIGAVALLVLASLSPRMLQLLHPEGIYHNLTLTAYALLIAGAVLIIIRAGHATLRNGATILTFFLIGGYILQCNWISTVNYLNTLAHYTTMTQILSRIRSLPDTDWDGRKIAVVGSYNLRSDYPFKPAVGVATEFIDIYHMQKLAHLMREDVTFLEAGEKTPDVLEYAATNPIWPHPNSVGVVNGKGVVIFSKEKTISKQF